MSMTFSEFKKRLGAEPRNRDAETLRALESDKSFRQAAEEAARFEDKLETALQVSAPDDLLDRVLAVSSDTPQPKQRNWMPIAMAASLLVAIVAAGTAWQQTRPPQNVEVYLASHFQKDGRALLGKAAAGVDADTIDRIMTALNTDTGTALSEQVRFIKFCPTPAGRGAHMVVNTEQGLVTVIFMPATQVPDREMIEFDGNHAWLVALDHGSAAIIGEMGQPVSSLDAIVRSAIRPASLDA
jgi:hypothetical protein